MRGVTMGVKTITVKDFPEPAPSIGEVVVKVKAAAICRADMSLYHGLSVFGRPPDEDIIVGHEPAGEVVAVGRGVTQTKVGDRVAIYLAVGCGHCRWCRSGYRNLCADWKCLGFDVHGGDADYLKVPEANCLPLPDDVSCVAGALSTDVIGTLYQAQRRLSVTAADTVLVVGLGPMGSGGLMVARGLGARTIAIDINEGRLTLARDLGADHTINPTREDAFEVIGDLTRGEGVAVALECSGSKAGVETALEATSKFGRVAFIGACEEASFRPKRHFNRKQLLAIGNWYFNISLHPEILTFIRHKKLPVEKLVTHRFSIEEAPTAFQLFDEGKTGKVVFVWQ